MRLIPLAIFLCKSWFDEQTTDSIASLIKQICACPDEGTRNMVMESLSRRITLLNDVPLAKDLKDGLTNPDSSPFLTEEVVLSPLGSRLFLAFSEVNPEACALALKRIIASKNDEEIRAMDLARRNLAWALDHMAFDRRSFHNAMLCLARFSLVETEDFISNNTTGLFVDRFAVLLAGTEVSLMDRIQVLKDLLSESRYVPLVKKALFVGLHTGHFYRSGGAEKQGMTKLEDYVPSRTEMMNYYVSCLDMLVELVKMHSDVDDIAKVLASNARGYYLAGVEAFLFKSLDVIAPKKNYIWEEMRDALSSILMYDAKKRNGFRFEEIVEWKAKLTKDDYVYKLLHIEKELLRNYNQSYEEGIKQVLNLYGEMAKELVDENLYLDKNVMSGIVSGESFHFNSYGMELSAYSKKKGVQKELLDVILTNVLNKGASDRSELILIHFLIHVEDRDMLMHVYDRIISSEKKYLLVAAYAIKAEGNDKLDQLFCMLDRGELSINDFELYFSYRPLADFDVKYVVSKLLKYGSQGAALVLSRCYHIFFEGDCSDEDYKIFRKQCLLMIDWDTFQMDEYMYSKCVNNYLAENHDEDVALHIQDLQEECFRIPQHCVSYYMGRLYRKVLFRYRNLLKDRLLKLLDEKLYRRQCISMLRTSYPQDGDTEPTYTFMSDEEWFEWVNGDLGKDREYVLALMFSFANGDESNPTFLRLIEDYWGDEVRDAFSARFHSFSWMGTGIPLYQSRILICEDYIKKLSNNEAKEWFKKEIGHWEKEKEQERLQNDHIKAIYD